MNKFILGQVVVTRAIADTIAENSNFSNEIEKCLKRYVACDWGEMDEQDKLLNDDAVKNGDDRIFAAYQTSIGKIYIITECDRSATTVLFPSDY